jgi:hypothetical protein
MNVFHRYLPLQRFGVATIVVSAKIPDGLLGSLGSRRS